MTGLPDRMRASDADRERTAESLRRAATDGRLDVDELDQRLSTLHASRTHAELAVLVDDLEELPAAAPAAVPVRAGEDGTSWVVAVMGASERKGRWRLGRRCTVVNVMGGSDIDLNDVELAAEEVELRVWSVMGGSEIRIPEGLDVEVSEFALMGGNGIDAPRGTPTPGGPRLRLRIVSIMGGTDVKRGRRKPSKWRRREGH